MTEHAILNAKDQASHRKRITGKTARVGPGPKNELIRIRIATGHPALTTPSSGGQVQINAELPNSNWEVRVFCPSDRADKSNDVHFFRRQKGLSNVVAQ